MWSLNTLDYAVIGGYFAALVVLGLALERMASKSIEDYFIEQEEPMRAIETLRALEDALLEFPGNTFVISHDRWFLDRIATHILSFEGDSHVEFFQGNYREYEEDKRRRLGEEAAKPHRIRYKALM